MAKKVRITVLRKQLYEDLAERFLSDGKAVGACPLLNENDVFIFTGCAAMPDGFCPWAWNDICDKVGAISSGASYGPWFNRPGLMVECCKDGIRPVSFLLERLEEDC
jgi:uncharacterized repeat protein (TIGR04076 family)